MAWVIAFSFKLAYLEVRTRVETRVGGVMMALNKCRVILLYGYIKDSEKLGALNRVYNK